MKFKFVQFFLNRPTFFPYLNFESTSIAYLHNDFKGKKQGIQPLFACRYYAPLTEIVKNMAANLLLCNILMSIERWVLLCINVYICNVSLEMMKCVGVYISLQCVCWYITINATLVVEYQRVKTFPKIFYICIKFMCTICFA